MKLIKFNKNQLVENYLRAFTGGANHTNSGKADEDFVDNCGYIAYDDCRPQTEDGLPDKNDCDEPEYR